MAALARPNNDDFSIFVGDLAPEVTDYVLQETFRQFFPSVRSAKVITDPVTARSKGYGFVRFSDEGQRDRALTEMNGHYISSRPIRVSLATARRNPGIPPAGGGGLAGMPGMQGGMGGPGPGGLAGSAVHPAELDPTNTTLFIGGLSAGVSEEQLRSIFGRFGDVVYTKIPAGKGCGFVQFVDRKAAEVAMAELNGQIIGSGAIRISWGRSTSRAAAVREQQGPGGGGAPFGALPGGLYGAAAGGFAAPFGAFAFDPTAAGGAAVAAGGYGAFGAPGAAAYGAAPDPYAAYGAYAGVDPSSMLAYQQSAFGGLGAAGLPGGPAGAGAANGANGAGLAPLQSMTQHAQAAANNMVNQVYDPLALTDTSKLNAAFVQRNQPQLLGSFLRAP